MTEQQKPDQGRAKPIGTWARGDEPGAGPASGSDRETSIEPIPGTPAAVPLAGQPPEQEPRTSPEMEHELDRLRRG